MTAGLSGHLLPSPATLLPISGAKSQAGDEESGSDDQNPSGGIRRAYVVGDTEDAENRER